jgi:hypothetical protein
MVTPESESDRDNSEPNAKQTISPFFRQSWINQVERWFATLSETCIRRGTHRSTRQLEQAIRQYIPDQQH